ncbi:hypothetical protein Rumeso_00547 [Rubellimicrobium mesophilum DSM 19309]|uniref:DUF2927 domain-containing protein n=1 Tax=Rubellimicrobium mesophilum DSM 19309 TaxID=442562 RepID=A0A017HU06_9RHOB|nr:hypothetical protein [Rubellimicrobium mesophilum]EYD77820.1 hypothetical protein Rumeso_00547 [Rubellimicrobium mesophilum DSM 19309]
MTLRGLLLLGLLAAGPAASAQEDDFLVTSGRLSGEDFYRLVACRALPGGPCTVDPVRWSPEKALDLKVGITVPAPDYPPETIRRMSQAVDHAISEINSAGAALHLRRALEGERPDITFHLASIREGDAIEGTGVWGVDGQVIGAALVTVWWDIGQDLTEAVIVMAEDLPAADIRPVVLEELTQAMGLMTDIRNPTYDDVSVFSEDSNRVLRLGSQDKEALRRHYPPAEP